MISKTPMPPPRFFGRRTLDLSGTRRTSLDWFVRIDKLASRCTDIGVKVEHVASDDAVAEHVVVVVEACPIAQFRGIRH